MTKCRNEVQILRVIVNGQDSTTTSVKFSVCFSSYCNGQRENVSCIRLSVHFYNLLLKRQERNAKNKIAPCNFISLSALCGNHYCIIETFSPSHVDDHADSACVTALVRFYAPLSWCQRSAFVIGAATTNTRARVGGLDDNYLGLIPSG